MKIEKRTKRIKHVHNEGDGFETMRPKQTQTGEMEVEFVHGNHLRPTPAGRPAFDAERRSLRAQRLPRANARRIHTHGTQALTHSHHTKKSIREFTHAS
jgi:hypothetical protein